MYYWYCKAKFTGIERKQKKKWGGNNFFLGSTVALTTIGYESINKRFSKMISRIATKDINYANDHAWNLRNGHPHIRTSLIGPSIVIPFIESHLMLDTAANCFIGNEY